MNKLAYIIVFLFVWQFSNGQDADLNKYKSMFTMNFIRYIGWTDEAKQGDFVIGVVKKPELISYLKTQSSGKKFGYQTIVIKEFKSVEEVTNCQIIFVGRSAGFKKNALVLKQKVNNKHTLIITESEGAVKSGSMINFVIRDDKMKFEVSESNAAAFGLKFSSSLLSMSSAIKK